MSENIQKTTIGADVVKNALKKAGKILLAILVVGFYINTIIVALFPGFSAKVYGFMGLSKAEEYCLVKVYEKTENNADLYNLIVFEQNQKNYQKELNYINLLMANGKYDEFCVRLDNSALKGIKDKSLIVHMCNTKGYLTNQKVKCLFNLGIGTETFIYSNLNSSNLIENSYGTYVDFIYDSKMTESQKKEKIETLNETFSSENNNVTMEDLFKDRIAKIKLEQVSQEDITQKILLEYALMQNFKAGYLSNLILENAIQAEEYRQLYLDSANAYYELVK